MSSNYQTIIFKKIVNFLFGAFGLFVFICLTPSAQAATSTVRGVGWLGDVYQEVFFNCLDDDLGDRLNVDQNLAGSGKYVHPYDEFHFYLQPCSPLVHGVYIDDNDNFSGQALNAVKGLISFSGTSTPPDSYASTNLPGNCTHTCNDSNNCWSCYNEVTQRIYGWARFDTSGEWIRLDSGLMPMPVMLQNCDSDSVFPGNNVEPGDFVGNALSTIAGIATNLSFNCKSEVSGNACATRDYRVYIGNLTVGKLSAPNWTYEQACLTTARGATLQWCKRSGIQTGYEIVVKTTNISPDISTSTAVCWSGIQDAAASQYNLPNTLIGGTSGCRVNGLGFDKNYYWWVRLYDELGQPTAWFQYDNNTGADTDANLDGDSFTFTTYKTEFPNPFMTWSPTTPLVGSTTRFSAITSQYYKTSQPNVAVPCVGTACSYLWSTSDEAFFSATTSVTTTIVFNQATGTTVSLRVMDTNYYFCSLDSNIIINYDLPIWREIKAQ